MVNEPSVDTSFITLTVSAFVEMDMPTTMPKMIMDDLMIMNDLEANSGVTSWFLLWGRFLRPSARTHSSGIVVSWRHRLRLAPADPVFPKNNQFGGHEGMIATNPSVLQGPVDPAAYRAWGARFHASEEPRPQVTCCDEQLHGGDRDPVSEKCHE